MLFLCLAQGETRSMQKAKRTKTTPRRMLKMQAPPQQIGNKHKSCSIAKMRLSGMSRLLLGWEILTVESSEKHTWTYLTGPTCIF